jgi:hypothetical protein
MRHIMDNPTFNKFVHIIAQRYAPYCAIETNDNAVFVNGCTPHEATKMQSAFHSVGLSVIVTPGTEYTFEFV